jgi:hypothetical protein
MAAAWHGNVAAADHQHGRLIADYLVRAWDTAMQEFAALS